MSDNDPVDVEVTTVRDWLLDRKDLVLIDCREESEYQTAKIPGSVLIPMSQWLARQGELEQFRNKHIVVHCHHGGRSARVTSWLRQNGFPNAQNMAGGIDAWSQEIDSDVPRY